MTEIPQKISARHAETFVEEREARSLEPKALGPAAGAADGTDQAPDTPLPVELLAGVQSRDSAALERFFDLVFQPVFGLALRLMGNREMAEDVTQEVFLKIYRFADQIDPERPVRNWVIQITYNACRDAWRSKSYQQSRVTSSMQALEGFTDTYAGDSPNPEEAFLRKQREKEVQEAITALPDKLRVPVVLHDYSGMSHGEIAEILGISHAAVRKRYSRALAQLARELRGRVS